MTNRNQIHRRPAPDGSELSAEAEDVNKQQARLSAILTALQKSGAVSVRDLSKELDASVVTIRRDLDALEKRILLRRTHGGAV